METRLLEQFVAVAEEGNVTRAAERLWAAQSTVSAGIASLERSLGARLFDRVGRRLELSPLGAELLPTARQVVAGVERMRDLAASDDRTLRGRVRLGIFTSMDIVDLTTVLRGFRERHPLVSVELRTSPSGTTGLVQDLEAGRLDLAYCGLPVTPSGLTVVPLRELPFRVFVAADHPLAMRSDSTGLAGGADAAGTTGAAGVAGAAGVSSAAGVAAADRAAVSLAELVDEPFIDTATGFGNRVILDTAFERLGLRRRIVAEMNDMPAVIRYAGAGVGIAVVPDDGRPHDAVALDLVDAVPPLRIGLAARTAPEPNRATRTLARDIVRARH